MTESDWATSTDPQLMLSFLRDLGPVSERKLRLFAVGTARRLRHLIVPGAEELLAVAEHLADGSAGPAARKRAREAAFRLGWLTDPSTTHRRGSAKAAVSEALQASAWEAANRTIRRYGFIVAPEKYDQHGRNWDAALTAASADLVDMLRDIFGNPFQTPVFAGSWRTEAVVALARGIYEERAWDRMPVLADALEDAGCDCIELLEHCRGPNTHVRGCWLVDLVVGKT